MSDIYLIRNLINGKVYVGQTTLTLRERWNCHLSAARNTTKPSYFQNAINKYGADGFSTEILVEAEDQEAINQLETFYIQEFNSTDHNKGYNTQTGGREGEIGGGRPVGIPVTQEHRDKLRQSHLGKKHSAEHNQHVSEALMGIKRGRLSDVHRGKIGIALLGHEVTSETKQAISGAWTPERRAAQSKITAAMNRSRAGLPRSPISPETAKKIGDAQRGEKHHMYGKRHSESTKQKMREAHARRSATSSLALGVGGAA